MKGFGLISIRYQGSLVSVRQSRVHKKVIMYNLITNTTTCAKITFLWIFFIGLSLRIKLFVNKQGYSGTFSSDLLSNPPLKPK